MRKRLSCASEPSCYGADGGRRKQRLLAGRVDGESSGASTTPRPVDYVGAEASATLEAWCGISARGGPNSGQRLRSVFHVGRPCHRYGVGKWGPSMATVG